jgi:alanyl aminopeptidase
MNTVIRCTVGSMLAWLLFTTPALAAFPLPPAEWPSGRLPADVVPLEYDLDLTIIPDTDRFSGRVSILVDVRKPLAGFWLHGQYLDVSHAEIVPANGQPIAAQYTEVGDEGVAWLALADELPVGPATVTFDYSADFGRGLNGLYKVTVGDDDYAFTQFESVYGRKAFPSFDEPGFKTPFDIAVTTRENYAALSNTRAVDREALPDKLQRIRYASTAPLPTYLIAFAVGPLDVVEHAPVPPNEFRATALPLRGIAARGQGPRLAYALANTAPMVTELERYFGRAYPFDKLDIVAVPDFAGGAMENAGLITYREGLLLIDDPAPYEQLRWFGMVHAHELGHQWFGNLVTMPWWDDIWLNEAFAAWIQARVAGAWQPDLRLDQFVQGAALRAMAADSLTSARQIREPVNNADDIISAFDSITYQKGAAVLQMFESYLGPDVFQAGIQLHMQRFAFGSATVIDLIESLEEVAPDDVALRAPFESFLFQPGVPYLDVTASCADNEVTLDLSQQRYLPIGSKGNRAQTWQVPVCLALGTDNSRSEHCLLLSEAAQTFTLPVAACPSWVMPNAGGNGYYRWTLNDASATGNGNDTSTSTSSNTNTNTNNGTDALTAVFLTELNASERLAFIDSLTAGMAAGTVAPAALLEPLAVFAAAPEPGTVIALADAYTRVLDFLVAADDLPAARAYGLAAFGPRLAGLDGLDNEATLTAPERARLKKSLTKLLALVIRDPDMRTLLRLQAYAYLGYDDEDPGAAPLDPDLREVAITVAVQDSDTDFVRFLINDISASQDALRRGAGVRALAYATNPAAQSLGREFALTGGGGMRRNEFQAWAGELVNRDSGAANWAWLQANIDAYMTIGSERAQRDAPLYFARGLCTADDAAALRLLFTELDGAYALSARKLDQGVETVELCAAARAELAPAVGEFFN